MHFQKNIKDNWHRTEEVKNNNNVEQSRGAAQLLKPALKEDIKPHIYL